MLKRLREALDGKGFGEVPKRTSKIMRAIRSTENKSTERRLRMALVRSGISGWRIRRTIGSWTPDFMFPNSKLAIFTDGCFWHGCPTCSSRAFKNNTLYWTRKIKMNRQKDRRVTQTLTELGWGVIRVWEHQLKGNCQPVTATIRNTIKNRQSSPI